MKSLIFYKTTADYDNTGEVLIYRTLLEYLRTLGNVVVDDVRSQSLFIERIGIQPSEKLSSFGKKSFLTFLLFCAIKNFFLRKKVIFATGVGDHSVRGVKGGVKNFIAGFFILFLRLCGVKVLRIGMSIKFEGFLSKLSERFLSLWVSNYFVRDSISAKNCVNAGVKKVKIAPDLSWGYQVKNVNAPNKSNIFVFSFRTYAASKKNQAEYKQKLKTSIVELINHICINPDNKVLLTHQCNADLAFMAEIKELFADNTNVILVPDLITLDNAMNFYGKAKVVVSNRLHVLLLAYKYGALSVCLTDLRNHKKIVGIFEDAGLSDLLVDFYNERFETVFEELCAIQQEKWLKIHSVESHNRETLNQIFCTIKGM